MVISSVGTVAGSGGNVGACTALTQKQPQNVAMREGCSCRGELQTSKHSCFSTGLGGVGGDVCTRAYVDVCGLNLGRIWGRRCLAKAFKVGLHTPLPLPPHHPTTPPLPLPLPPLGAPQTWREESVNFSWENWRFSCVIIGDYVIIKIHSVNESKNRNEIGRKPVQWIETSLFC